MALHKKSWAVIDRPYSLCCPTVGALYGAVKKMITTKSGGCKTPTGGPNVVYRPNKREKFRTLFGAFFKRQFLHSPYEGPSLIFCAKPLQIHVCSSAVNITGFSW